jgi:hypothetical protein
MIISRISCSTPAPNPSPKGEGNNLQRTAAKIITTHPKIITTHPALFLSRNDKERVF